MFCKDTALCLKCHGRMERVLLQSFNSTNMVGRLHRTGASFISCISRPSRQKESAGAPFLSSHWITAPEQLCVHPTHLQMCRPILGHASVDCDLSMWSYRLTADAQDNELIGDGVYCRGCGRGGRRGRLMRSVGLLNVWIAQWESGLLKWKWPEFRSRWFFICMRNFTFISADKENEQTDHNPIYQVVSHRMYWIFGEWWRNIQIFYWSKRSVIIAYCNIWYK